jgi:hypothetical protein
MEPIHIPNIANYTQEVIDGVLILTPKVIEVSDDNVMEFSMTKSNILSCKVSDRDGSDISTKTKYRGILVDIWKTMPVQKLLQNTGFNFKMEDMKGDKGYFWCKDLKMSMQSKDASGAFKEIIGMCKVARYSLDIHIQLRDDTSIHYILI